MMAKRSEYDISAVILTMLVLLVPMFGSGQDKKIVIYASLFVSVLALACGIYKYGRIYITKTALLLFCVAAYCGLQMLWVSDKGSQFALMCMFLAGGVISTVTSMCKRNMSSTAFEKAACATIYFGAVFYAVMAFLHQLFIENNFFTGNMDFGYGTGTLTAIVALGGIVAGLKLFYEKQKTAEFYISLLLLCVIFALSKSIPVFFAASIMLLIFTLNLRHKKVEALAALVLVAGLGIANFIYLIYAVLTGQIRIGGAVGGLAGIMGLGAGGYNASHSILNKAYTGFIQSFAFLTEAMGVFGVLIMAVAVIAAIINCVKKTSFRNMTGCTMVIMGIFANSMTLYVFILLCSMYFTCTEEGQEVRVHPMLATVAVVPMAVFAVLTYARVCFMVGDNHYDLERYKKAEDMYVLGAKMEFLSSEGWEKAYKSANRAEGKGDENLPQQKKYLENAFSFNKKNYEYKRKLADVYAKEGDYRQALMIWDGIMEKYDREYLYPEYVGKMRDVMAYSLPNLAEMEGLYLKIGEYAKKTTDKEIKFQVNNILDECQKYYLLCRDGEEAAVVDMFPIYEIEEPVVAETEMLAGE